MLHNYSKKIFFVVAFVSFVSLFFSFNFIVAAGLDYDYPEVPGTSLNVTSDSSLGDAIKYFASWAIIIGAIAAFLSLIYAGFLYLSSTGNPGATVEAKGRIWKAGLGLLILFASYLIMVTLNPQLTVLKLEKTTVNQGVILLTEEGLSGKVGVGGGLRNGDSVEQIVAKGQAIYLPQRMADAQNYKLWNSETTFGEFERKRDASDTAHDCPMATTTFSNFKLKYIGFLSSSENFKVVAYSNKNFKTDNDKISEYTIKGQILNTGFTDVTNPVISLSLSGIQIIEVRPSDFKSEVDYFVPEIPGFTSCSNPSAHNGSGDVAHPPMSFEIRDISPGVYLYADKPGEEQYLNTDKDFTKSDTAFNDKAERIEIKNGADNDYIAVLHEKDNYSGQMKIFFETKNRKIMNSLPPPAPVIIDLSAGNTIATLRKLIAEATRVYGFVQELNKEEVSSVTIREISSDPTVCKSVTLCTGKSYSGECVVFSNGPNNLPDYEEHRWITRAYMSPSGDNVFLPIYTPQNFLNQETITKQLDAGGNEKTKNVNFYKKIKSIYIEGDCMVALFENWTTNTNFPGAHSEVFFESQMDLTPYQIHSCGILSGLSGRLLSDSCVSAIAIYPIKK